jgi:hypothetical protein
MNEATWLYGMNQNQLMVGLTWILLNGVALWTAEGSLSSAPCRTSGSSPGGDTSVGADGSVVGAGGASVCVNAGIDRPPPPVELGARGPPATVQAKEGGVVSRSMGDNDGDVWPSIVYAWWRWGATSSRLSSAIHRGVHSYLSGLSHEQEQGQERHTTPLKRVNFGPVPYEWMNHCYDTILTKPIVEVLK